MKTAAIIFLISLLLLSQISSIKIKDKKFFNNSLNNNQNTENQDNTDINFVQTEAKQEDLPEFTEEEETFVQTEEQQDELPEFSDEEEEELVQTEMEFDDSLGEPELVETEVNLETQEEAEARARFEEEQKRIEEESNFVQTEYQNYQSDDLPEWVETDENEITEMSNSERYNKSTS